MNPGNYPSRLFDSVQIPVQIPSSGAEKDIKFSLLRESVEKV